jgi:hypothetical protein
MTKLYGLFIILFCLFLFTLPSKVCAQNMLLNSSFELWFDSLGIRMPFAWYTSEANDSGSATRTTDMHTGIYALKLTGSDTIAYAMTLSFCTAGHNYYFSGWTKSTVYIAGSFIITWLKLSQQPLMDPVIATLEFHLPYMDSNGIQAGILLHSVSPLLLTGYPWTEISMPEMELRILKTVTNSCLCI